jgi:uncharacterized integral membrane protein
MKNKLSKLNDEDLLKKIKLLKGVIKAFSILYVLIILLLLYLFLNKNFGQTSVAVFVPILVLPAILSPLLISYNLHRKEGVARKL